MIQCETCEYFQRGPGGQPIFLCDPHKNIKEPECLTKLQLHRSTMTEQKIERLVRAYEQMLGIYQRMQPMQEKMFEHMEREIREAEDGDSWKLESYDDDDDGDDGEENYQPDRDNPFT